MYRFIFTLLTCFFVINSIGQFARPVDLSKSTANPKYVEVFDVDYDGDLDIISVSFNDRKIAYYLNLGGGEFSDQKIISNDLFQVRKIIHSDLDGDGLDDVVAVASDGLTFDSAGKIVWFKNLGSGLFGTEQLVSLSNFPLFSFGVADFDEDGDEDIVASSLLESELVYLIKSGSGEFETEIVLPISIEGPGAIVPADIDGDGDSDIVTSGTIENELVWIENSGNGVFFSPQLIADNTDGKVIVTGDVDQDGDVDIVYQENGAAGLFWAENDGEGEFDSLHVIPTTEYSGIKDFVLVDIDGDSDIDLVSSSSDITTIVESNLSIHENDGFGNFGTPQVISDEPFGITILGVGDVSDDGQFDIVTGSIDHVVGWLENQGDMTFSSRIKISPGIGSTRDVQTVDIDQDGLTDILTANGGGGVRIFKNLGDGMFSDPADVNVNDIAWNVRAADVDGDNDLDIICTNLNIDREIKWYENLGQGIFGNQNVIVDSVGNAWGFDSGDLDGDGDMDVAFTEYTNGKVSILNNLGGTFEVIQIDSENAPNTRTLSLSDIDEDGDLDLIYCLVDDGGAVVRRKNLGDFNFSSPLLIELESNMNPLNGKAVDLNSDGILDILVALNGFNSVIWYQGIGNGGFNSTRKLISDSTEGCYDVLAADLDTDGDLDVVSVSNGDDKLAWYENLGQGEFGEQQLLYTISSDLRSIAASDLDNDGDIDLVTASSFDAKTSFYENLFFHDNTFKGSTFYDFNQNGLRDSSDFGIDFIEIECSPQAENIELNSDGNYLVKVSGDSGTYFIEPIDYDGFFLTTDSAGYSVSADSVFGSVIDSLNFGFFTDSLYTDLSVDITGGFPRCNDPVNFWIDLSNSGTSIPSGIVQLDLNEDITFISSEVLPDSIINQSIYWHFDAFMWDSSLDLNLQVEMPDFNSIGDTLTSVVHVYTFNEGDDSVFSISDTLDQILVCAYDPNDKAVSPAGAGDEGYIALEQELEYLIRFQNTGNDTAFTVTIKDQLDSNLDFTSVNPIASSHHPMQVNVDQDGEIEFIFENIMLPDSNVDQLGSQGFVKFSVTSLPDLAPNTPIDNNAGIYFDFNSPIITNTVLNTIECYNTPFPSISYADTLLVTDVEGAFFYQWFFNGEEIPGAIGDTLSPIGDGIYTLSVADSTNCAKLSNGYSLTLSGIDEIAHLNPIIFPNPFRQTTTISFSESLNGQYGFEVYSVLGQLMHRENSINDRKVILHKNDLGKGVFLCYLINSQSGARYFVGKVVVI